MTKPRQYDLLDYSATGFRLIGERAEDTQRTQRELDQARAAAERVNAATLSFPLIEPQPTNKLKENR